MVDLKAVLSKEEKKEYYWALVIEPGWVQAGIWAIENGKVKIISVSPNAAWESEEELINSADTALSGAIQDHPEEESEPTKTVFGVSGNWVSEGQIKAEYLEKIKKICSKLSLEPVGFVVLPEAVAHYLKSEEGSPLSAIVLGVGKDDLDVSLFKMGELKGSSLVARSVSAADDIAEGLTRFATDEPLPSRFVLYNGKEAELEEVKQSLLKADWDKYEKIKFLHTPKVEMIESDKKVLATALAGGSELASAASVEGVVGEKEEPKEEKKDAVEQEVNEKSNIEKVSPAALGFVVGQDVATKASGVPIKDKAAEEKSQEVPAPQANQPIVDSGPQSIPQDQLKGKKKLALAAPLAFLAAIPAKLISSINKGAGKLSSAGKIKEGSGGKKILIAGGITFLILIVGGFIAWWYLPKATVTVYVSPYQLEESVSVFVDPSIESADSEEGILPGKLVTKTNSGDKTKSTTGTKTVGERATGEVTLYRAGLLLTVPSGTVLTGSGNLVFTLDDGVTVASGSASTPGTVNTKITAEDIGAQYNLASGESFTVSNFPTSEIEAKNESSFSGGSSREINAVSEEDREELEEDLKEELVEEIIQETRSELEEGDFLIEEATKVDITDKEFSNKVGDEASTLKLSLEIEASVLIVKKADLIEVAQEVLKDRVAEGFVLREDQIDVTFEFIDEDGGIYELTVTFGANLLPEVKPDEVVEKIKGKYPPLAKEFLTDIEGFERAEIVIIPRFPGRLGTLPRISKNITIEVSSQK